VSARDRNSQITGRPGTTSPKVPAPTHLRTPLPRLANNGEHRLLITETETETYLRDEIDGDPSFESPPLDRTRSSRIVYADEFDLPSH
jgi:hypothetical protein